MMNDRYREKQESLRRSLVPLGRILLFLGARVGPAATTLLLAVAYGLSDRAEEYLKFSIGFTVAALAQSLMTGWWAHWLVRSDPNENYLRGELRRFQARLFGGAFLLSVAAGFVAFIALGEGGGSLPLAATAVGLCGVQIGFGSAVLARHQFRMQHQRLFRAEISRAIGGFAGALIGLVTTQSGVISLLGFALGSLLGVLFFVATTLPGFGVQSPRSGAADPIHELRQESMKYGLPIVGVAVAVLVIQFSDRFILSMFDGNEIAGSYSASYDLVNRPVGLALAAISLASQRTMFAMFDDDDETQRDESALTRRDLWFQLAAAGIIGIGLLVAGWVAEDIRVLLVADLGLLVPLLVFSSAVLLGVSHTLMRPLQARHETARIGRYAGIAAACNVGLNLALIGDFGASGAATATFLSVVTFVAFLSRASFAEARALAYNTQS